MKITPYNITLTTDFITNFQFRDIFDIDEVQHLQDLFSDTHGVASIITYPDGVPITNPSNFCRLCNNIVRTSEKGRANCYLSDALLGRPDPLSPVIQPCLSCGLLDAGTSIIVGGKHIANWLIGQVRNNDLDEQQILQYAYEIGANKEDFTKAFNEVPVMSLEQFKKVANMLFAFANILSEKAYKNLQLKMQIAERDNAISLLQNSEENMRYIVRHDPNAIAVYDCNLHYVAVSERYLQDYAVSEEEIIGKHHDEVFPEMPQKWRDVHQRCLAGATESNKDDSFERPDGSITYNSWECRPWRQVNGEIGGIITYTEVTTERKKAENALIESEIKYRAFFENSMDAILLTSPDGKTISANQAACTLFGYSEEELIKLGRLGIEDDSDLRLSVLLAERNLNGKAQGEVTFIRKDGLHFPAEISTSIFKNIEGIERTSMIIRDITERKKIQNEIKFQADLLNNVGQSVIAIDLQGNVIYWNNAAEKIYGWSVVEALGQNIIGLIPANQTQEQAIEVMKNLIERKTWSGEFLVKRKDGSNITAFVTDAPIFDPDGKLIGVIGISTDISERKHADEKLLKLSRAVEQTVDSILITDRDGVIEYVNHAFEVLTGYSSGEALGKTPRILKSGTKDREYYEVLWNTILSGKVFRAEVVNKKKNGVLYDEAKTISPIFDKNNRITHFVATGVDITERKQAEKELIAAKNNAEESDRLKSAFLANMSHEIRTPMNGILGFAGLLLEPKLTGEEQQEYISIIERSGARMLNIINDIVSISKVESGQMEVSIKETNINEQIKYIYTFFKSEADQKGIQLLFKNSLPFKESIINTDREKVYAILTNLVKNALKFTKAGSVEFGYNPKGNGNSVELEFYVKDTGIGIHPMQKEFIFERFRQGSESLNRNYEGAGLGLTISRAYVEMLGGKIWVDTEINKGSTFYFTIPQNLKAREEKIIPYDKLDDPVENQTHNIKLLIVEDDEITQKFIAAIVKMYTTEILTAKTGSEAVIVCRNNPDIDLVLMDIKMPEMDGYEVTMQIRKFNTEVVIIAQTAYALSGDREKALVAGCNDYIAKPINKDILMALMKKYFKN